jgi:hypothetical protein
LDNSGINFKRLSRYFALKRRQTLCMRLFASQNLHKEHKSPNADIEFKMQ